MDSDQRERSLDDQRLERPATYGKKEGKVGLEFAPRVARAPARRRPAKKTQAKKTTA